MSKYKKVALGACLGFLISGTSLFSGEPVLIKTLEVGGNPLLGALDSGNNYYYIYSDSEFQVYDVTDPENAEKVDSISSIFSSGFTLIDSKDEYVYVPSNNSGEVLSLNIKNPKSIVLEETFTGLSPLTILGPGAIDSEDQYLYLPLTSGDFSSLTAAVPLSGLNIIDISDPSNLTLAHSISISESLFSNIVIDSDDKYLYVIDSTSGTERELVVVDISNPLTASVVATLSLTSGSGGPNSRVIRITSSDSNLYILNGRAQSIDTIDISDPTAPVLVDPNIVGDDMFDIVLDTNDAYMYVTNGDDASVMVFDLSNPAFPSELTPVTDIENPRTMGIDPDNKNLYVTGVTGLSTEPLFMYALDITNPNSASLINNFILGIGAEVPQVLIDSNGGYSYTVGLDAGQVYIVFNPNSTISSINGLTCSTKVVNYPPKDRINVLKWGPSDTQGSAYFIKRNGELIGVELQNALGFEDHARPKGKTDIYTVQGINLSGGTTPEVTCTVQAAN